MRAARLLVLPLLLAAIGVSGCGSSSSDARRLISETFSNAHPARSGKIDVRLDLAISGVPSIKGPVSLQFGGPFDRSDPQGVPRFAFTLTGTVNGRSLSAGLTSTGQQGFVFLQNQPYALGRANSAAFRQGFGRVTDLSHASGLGGISWLTDPKDLGEETIGGVPTEHVSAGVDVGRLVDSINAHRKPGTPELDPRLRTEVAAGVQQPRFDFWTGTDDKRLRRVKVHFHVDVAPESRAKYGGLSSVVVDAQYDISDLDRPQTITAPANPRPYKELRPRLLVIEQVIARILGSAGVGSAGTVGGAGASGGIGSPRYQQCVQSAGSDIAAVQRCASLLGR